MKINFAKLAVGIAFFVAILNHSIAQGVERVVTDQADIKLLSGSYTGENLSIGVQFTLQPGWHIYWREPGDTGFPTQIDLQASQNINKTKLLWPAPKRITQELEPGNILESYGYEQEIIFPIEITAENAGTAINVNAHVTYAICSDICIPGEVTLSRQIPPGFHDDTYLSKINDFKNIVPKENGSFGMKIEDIKQQGADIEIIASNSHDFHSDAFLLVEGEKGVEFTHPTAKFNFNDIIFTFQAKDLRKHKGAKHTPIELTLINGKEAIELKSAVELENVVESVPPEIQRTSDTAAENKSNSILLMILFAFIGGLILNIMPCVLPVLSIKLLGVIKHGGSDKPAVARAFILTAAGILFSMFIFALITLLLKDAGGAIGWGLHFQQPYFIIAIIIILVLFAANMWGFYEINLPNIKAIGLLPNLFKNVNGKCEALEHFFSGMLVTILATPCTAPFLGTAVGFAVTRGALEIFVIFLSMGVGLALPYLLTSIFPGLITKLPRPGAWMLMVRKIMGALLLLAVIWLLWVLSNQLGKLAAIILLILCVIKLFKLWAANHIRILKTIRVPLLAIIIILAFILPMKVSEKSSVVTTYDIWQEFQPQNISQLVKKGRVVFVDVTADWCLTCKVNAFMVIDKEEIKSAIKTMSVIAMRADWTNKDAEISKFLNQNERAGIPFNIVYGPAAPQGIILPELLSKEALLAALRKASGSSD